MSLASKRTQISPEVIGHLYWDEKLPQREIAKLFHISRSSLRQLMRENNIPTRNRSEAGKLAEESGRRIYIHRLLAESKLSKEELERLYKREGLSDKAIGKLIGVSKNSVRKLRLKWGITSREFREAARLSRWKGGKYINRDGYVLVRLEPDNPFFEMANQGWSHYVLEHRLVMAQYLGRPLTSTEVVHHKNGVKTDNRIENLELIPSPGEHGITRLSTLKEASEQLSQLRKDLSDAQRRIEYLEKRVTLLEAENAVLRSRGCSDCRRI